MIVGDLVATIVSGAGMARIKDLTGQRFGRLVAVCCLDYRTKRGGSIWTCSCDCGNAPDVRGRDLISGNTKSCGCLNKKLTSQRYKEINRNKRRAAELRPITGNKRCCRCKQIKKIGEFYLASRRIDKADSICKKCALEYNKTDKRAVAIAKSMLKAGLLNNIEIPTEIIEARAELIKIRRKIKEMTK